MTKFDLNNIKKIFFVGIGGIGVSAVARMMLALGKSVSGSDLAKSEITDELEKLGAKITIGQNAEFIDRDTDLVIYSPAIAVYDSKLIEELKNKNVVAITYPESLGLISKNKYTIAISGAHGKTTTTAMISKIMIEANLEPTVIVGSLIKDEKTGVRTNFIKGGNRPACLKKSLCFDGYFVVEACEYQRSFLNLLPSILVITNIDDDHLDYYKNLAGVQRGFLEMVSKVNTNGYIVCNPRDPKVAPALKSAKCRIVDYMNFYDASLLLKIPGEHNRLNAAAALAVSHIVEVNPKSAKKSLENYSGVWRRFEFRGETKEGALVYDDYGHHPTEVKATLLGARELYPKNKITAVFQPHLFSRTKEHLKEFGQAFDVVDEVIIAPIYAAREKDDKTVNGQMVAEEIVKNGGQAFYVSNFEKTEKMLTQNAKKGDVIIVIGAGDINKISNDLIKN